MEDSNIVPRAIDFSEGLDESHNIPVYLRIKPIESAQKSIEVLDECTVETKHPFRSNKKATFTKILDENCEQQEVFEATTSELVDKFLIDGANVMTFAYGVTSSGKTHTVMGSVSCPGIIPRILEKMFGTYKSRIERSHPQHKPIYFDTVQSLSNVEMVELEKQKMHLLSKAAMSRVANLDYNGMHFGDRTQEICYGPTPEPRASPIPDADSCVVWISIYEIYNEVITDLLQPNAKTKKNLQIGQDKQGRSFVKDLIQIPVTSAAEAFALLQVASKGLSKATTALNQNSSRSHMIFTVKMVHSGGSLSEIKPFVNQFVIGDLAGSERQGKTHTKGAELKQASAINNSLLVLGRCLEAFRKKDKSISVPFRDSKLTRMLNPFFTSGGLVSLIICVNPSIHLQDETVDTIRFSAIASQIVQKADRPADRLQRLRRMSEHILGSPVRNGPRDYDEFDNDAELNCYEKNGQVFVEIQASFFNEMAHDIFKAEKSINNLESQVEKLNERIKNEEDRCERITQMYQDRMTEQRDNFFKRYEDAEATNEQQLEELRSEYDEEIEALTEKYDKYKREYVKLSEYVKAKLWPEVRLYRERFGHLPEFPPKDAQADVKCENNENSIKYWQEKVAMLEGDLNEATKRYSQKDAEFRNVIAKLREERKELVELQDRLHQSEKINLSLEQKFQEFKTKDLEISRLHDRVEELLEDVHDKEAKIRSSEEKADVVKAEHKIETDNLREEISSMKADIVHYQDERKSLEKTIFKLREQNTCLMNRMSELSAAPNNDGELKKLAGDKQELEAELQLTKQMIQTLEEEKSELSDRVAQLEMNIQEMRDREESLAQQESSVKKQLAEASSIRRKSMQIRNADMENLQTDLEEARDEIDSKEAVISAQRAEIDELKVTLATLKALPDALKSASDENQSLRQKIKADKDEKDRLFKEVQKTRSLQVELEFLQSKFNMLQRKHEKSMLTSEESLDSSRASRTGRRRRSQSQSEVDKSVLRDSNFSTPATPAASDSTRKFRTRRFAHNENSVLDDTLDSIRDTSLVMGPQSAKSTRSGRRK